MSTIIHNINILQWAISDNRECSLTVNHAKLHFSYMLDCKYNIKKESTTYNNSHDSQTNLTTDFNNSHCNLVSYKTQPLPLYITDLPQSSTWLTGYDYELCSTTLVTHIQHRWQDMSKIITGTRWDQLPRHWVGVWVRYVRWDLQRNKKLLDH